MLDMDHPPTVGADDEVVARQRTAATAQAIASLDPDLRAALVLQQIEGLSYLEVAAILDISEGPCADACTAPASSSCGP